MGLMGALGLVPRFGTGDGESALPLMEALGLVARILSLDQGLLSLRSVDFRTGLAGVPGDLWVALPEANILAVCSASITAALTWGILSRRQLSSACNVQISWVNENRGGWREP